MKKKILCLLIVCGLIASGSFIYNKKSQINTLSKNNSDISLDKTINNKVEDVKDEDYFTEVTSHADLKFSYDNLKALTKASQIVVEGTVIESTSLISNPTVSTEFKLQVSKCYKGNIKEGDILTFRAAGGVISLEEALKLNEVKKDFEEDIASKLTAEEIKSKKVKYTFEGVPTIKKGDSFIICAENRKVSGDKEAYVALSLYQGYFKLQNDKVSGYMIDVENKNDSSKISKSTSNTIEMDKEDFIIKLEEALRND